MSNVRAKRARRWRLFNRAISRLRAAWAPKAVTFDLLEQRRMLSSTLGIGNVALIEPANGIGAASFPLTLSEISTSDVTVKYKTISGSAKAGKDFVGTRGSLVIPAGTLTENLTITIIGGVSGNTTKQFEIKLLKATNATIGSNNIATGSITDNITPTLSVQSATTTEGEKHSLKLAVILSGKSTTPVTTHWSTADGSALAGIDYAASQGDLKFKPGQTAKKISIPIIGTSTPNNTETFNVNLSNPTNATVGVNGVETIVSTNGLNQIYINDAQIIRPASGYKDLNFKVHLLHPSDGTVSVEYTTAPRPGSVGQYVSVTGVLQFLKGQKTSIISVPIVGTTFYNPEMTFDVELSNPVDARIADGDAIGTIDSNSSPPQTPPPFVSVNSISGNEGNSGDTPFTFNVTLSTPSAQPVVVYYQTQDGTAKDGVDYAGGSGAVYFPAGATVEPVTVHVLGNTTLEQNKTFDLDLTGATNALLSPTGSVGEATIVNDDFPTLSVSDTVAPATSVGTSTIATFIVTLSEPTDADVTANYFTSDGTATVADGDYDAATGTLDFAPGETTKTVDVTVNGKGLADVGDTFFLNLSNVSNTAILGTAQGTATIIQTPSISMGDVTVSDGADGATADFAITLSVPSRRDITVQYTTRDGTAVSPGDYTAVTGSVTFPAGATAEDVSVSVSNVAVDGGTFFLDLSSPVNATLATTEATATISNTPRISIADASQNEGDSGAMNMQFAVSLSNPSLNDITVNYFTSDGSASGGIDYTAESGGLDFPAGQTVASINVPILGNTTYEPDKTFFVQLDGAKNASLSDAIATGTIVNDDPLPTIALSPASVEEGDGGNVQMTFIVSLSNPSYQSISVDYFTSDGSANAVDDYQSTSGELDFAPGETTGTVSVEVNGDTIAETDEVFFLNFSNAVNANLPADPETAGTILNDDGGSISINNVIVPENDPNFNPTQAIFTVTLSTPYADDVFVQYNTVDDSALGGPDYVSTSGSIDFAPGQTQKIITIPINDAFLSDGGTKDFLVNFNSVSAGVPVEQDTGTATIVENDSQPGIQVYDTSVEESADPNSQPTMDFPVYVFGPHALPITVDYNTFDNGSASGGVDYTPVTGTLTFAPTTDYGPAEQIISVTVTGGLDPLAQENFGLSLTNIQNAADYGDTAFGIINNDNVAPLIGFSYFSTSLSMSENDQSNAGNMSFEVDLSHSYTQDVTVNYMTQDDTASGGVDYLSANSTLTIPAGQTSGFIEIPIINNTIVDGDRTFDILLSTPTNATLNDTSIQATGTIIDDDAVPTATVSTSPVSEGDSGTTEEDFTINLSGPYNNPVTVDYSTTDGSAHGGVDDPNSDYESTSGSVIFQPGQTSITVPVLINGNTFEQSDRNFNFNISSGDVPIGGSGIVLGIIQDDDEPLVDISAPSLIEPPAGQTQNAEFTVSLEKPLSYPVFMNYYTSGGQGEFTSTSGSLDFEPGQTSMTVDIPISGGAALDGNDSFDLNVVVHDPLNGDTDAFGSATVYATNDPSETDMSVNYPTLSPIDADNSTLSFNISNSGSEASGNDQIKFYAVSYTASGGGDCYQIEAFDPATNQIINTIDPIAPGGDQSFNLEPLMVDSNGNPIPAGYYNIKIVLSAQDFGTLACATSSNELPYIHTQVVWTGAAGDDEWSDPANWNTGAVPGLGDDVAIPQNQPDPIYYEDVNTEINSLVSNSPLILAGGVLMVDTTVQVNADFELQGGELDNATILPGNDGQEFILTPDGGTLKNIIAGADIDGTQNGATADFLDSLEVDGTFYIGDSSSSFNSSTINFDTDDSACFHLTGDGMVEFGKSSANEIDNFASMLSIGSNVTLAGRNGTIENENDGFVQNNGAIALRDLTINGNLVNNGQLYPGGIGNTGTLIVNGDFTQTSNGATTIDIGMCGSGGFDQIEVSGAANLDGTLNYQLVGNYQPADGTTFDVIDASSVNGAFANFVNVGSNPYYTFSVSYSDTDVVLTSMYIGPVTYYVDASNTDASNPDGLSWSGALDDLQQALALAHPGDTIDVAGGTYYPGSGQSDSFVIPSGVDVEGGFEGLSGGDPNNQDPSQNVSILSGDIGAPGFSGDNSYYIVTASYTDSSTRLYGFTIENGNSSSYGAGLVGDNADLTISNCIFQNNESSLGGSAIYLYQSFADVANCAFVDDTTLGNGGAIFVDSNSIPTISNDTFQNNDAFYSGGAIFVNDAVARVSDSTFQANGADVGGAISVNLGTAIVSDCVFIQNVAYGYAGYDTNGYYGGGRGGAIAANNSHLTVTSSTFSANVAQPQVTEEFYGSYGGAIGALNSSVTVANSILWNDQASYYSEIYSGPGSTVTVTSTDIGDPILAAGSNDIDADPLFVRNPGTNSISDPGDLYLSFGSPALNVGDDLIPGVGATDIAGNQRVQNGQIDLGAYETRIIYVDLNVNGSGTSWSDAYEDLQTALSAARPDNIVEVAGGTYHPTSDTNQNISFVLPINAAVYGGFAGSARPDSPDTRDFTQYATILSGDLGSGIHSYHVVATYVPDDGYTTLTAGTRLDGFTITGGHTGDGNGGGGIWITEGSPTIANCTFIDNASDFAGGAVGISQATPTIINCVFTDNTAPYGGAIAGTSGGGGLVTGGTFTHNSAVGQFGDGGAIYLNDSGLVVQDSTFYANSASDDGGAILGVDFSIDLTNCVFVGNVAAGNDLNDEPYAGRGGAIYDQDGLLTIKNSTFTANSAQGVTYDGTYFGGYGGAIAASENATITISNSIIWNNSAYTSAAVYYDSSSNATITYSDIDDSDLAAGSADVDADPMFVRNPDAGLDGVWGTSDDDYGNLQLVLGSPGIDAGNNADIPSGVTTDILGNPRIINAPDTGDSIDAIVDMGAYETWPVYVDSGIESAVRFGGIQPQFFSPGSSWAGAYTDLNEALDNAQTGQMIFVAGGTYSPGDTVNSTFNLVNGVGLFGGFDGNETVTPDHRDTAGNPSVLTGDLIGTGTGQHAYHVITAEDVDSSTVLDGFLIVDGITGVEEADQNGAGMILNNANLSINDCVFNNNTGTSGGAIYAADSSPLITNSTFGNDIAAIQGGAIYFLDGSPSLVRDIFSNDTATQGNDSAGGAVSFDHSVNAIVYNSTFTDDSADVGGAITLYAGSAYFSDDTFSNDTISADSGGGAIAGSGTVLTITGSSFTGNGADISSDIIGGAIDFSGGELNIDSTTFTDNSAQFGGAILADGTDLNINASSFNGNNAAQGGAIATNDDTDIVTNSTFVGNSAAVGGALYFPTANITIDNSTFTDNAATDPSSFGGAIFANSGGVDIDNSILWNDSANTDPEISRLSAVVTVAYSDVDGGYAGTGNIDADPQFSTAPVIGAGDSWDGAGVNYGYLAPDNGSPAIDAGANSFVTTSTDLNGNPRIANAVVDMGAYEQQVIYVDANLVGGTDDGSSWANAFTSLTDALDAVHAGERIDVAGGTYTPSTSGNEGASFILSEDTAIYGGYAGSANAENPYLRDTTTYTSILSGDVGNDNNAYHVIYAKNANGTILNGFTISGGSAYGSGGSDQDGGGIYVNNSDLSIANCAFQNNSGYYGGAISENDSNLTISDSTFSNNSAFEASGAISTFASTLNLVDDTFDSNIASFGGAISGGATTVNVTNSLFTDNTATGASDTGGQGGAIDLGVNSHLTVTNCTFSGNAAQTYNGGDGSYPGYGGAIYASDSDVVVTNSILWGDSADTGQEIIVGSDSTLSVTNTDIQDSDLSTGTGDIDVDPQFYNGTYQLTYSSPAINAGNNSAVPNGVTTDLAGHSRIVDGTVDMGAYEFDNYIYVDPAATGNNDGTSWTDAFTDLNNGTGHGFGNNARIEIAAGTYTPGNFRSASFQLGDEGLYGGYAGAANNPGNPGVRNVALYDTILSGDVSNTPGDNTDNAYHVVVTDDPSTLDGLSITGGYANVSGGSFVNNSYGGAIFDQFFVTISNCTIFDNFASEFGGGIFVNPARTAIITNTTFENNSALLGGAIFTQYNGNLTITGSTFIANQSQDAGGAIWAQGNASVSNSVFDNNNGGSGGGGAIGTQSTNLGGPLIHPNISLVNDVFDDNSTAGNGGGFYNAGANLTIINATFTANSAGGNGGALWGSADQVVNSILWNDTDSNGITEEYGADPSKFSSDDIEGGLSGGFDINNTDPQFVAAPTSGTDGIFHTSDDTYGDLQLQSTSPLIEAGDNSVLPASDTTDAASNPRIDGTNVDIGAYEFHIAATYVDAGATGADDGSSWANAYTTLAEALANPITGNRIDIAGGTYYPTTGDPAADTTRTDTFLIPEGVSIYGGYEGSNGSNPGVRDTSTYPTILSGEIGATDNNADNAYHVVTLTSVDSTTILDGLTISDGNANGTSTDGEGGGLFLTSSSPTINDCIIKNNTATIGGGVYNLSSSPTFNNSTISNNTSTSFGAGFYNSSGTLTLENSTVSNNSASTSAAGGIANFDSGVLVAENTTFSGNSAASAAGIDDNSTGTITLIDDTFTDNDATGGDGATGAISIATQTGDNTISGCTFTDNVGNIEGGAITDVEASLDVSNCTFTGNTANSTTGQGGAIYYLNGITSATMSILNCVFDGNTAGQQGGAIANLTGSSAAVTNCIFSLNTAGTTGSVAGMGGAVYTSDSSPTFVNCTFAGNAALLDIDGASYGGAMYSNGSGASTVSNCILWNDSADTLSEIYDGGMVNVDHSDLTGGATVNGNSGSDPLFVRAPGTNDSSDYGDLHLQLDSPAIAAGDIDEVPSGVTTDLDGNPRTQGGDVDMGAYET